MPRKRSRLENMFPIEVPPAHRSEDSEIVREEDYEPENTSRHSSVPIGKRFVLIKTVIELNYVYRTALIHLFDIRFGLQRIFARSGRIRWNQIRQLQ